ncbi:hypothetical protein BK127_27850 [Paenibacillus sp. FSL H7-0331]|nr:hypothetical protein BK127_27850 [Paenibacillus sp. FSL H7-0331]
MAEYVIMIRYAILPPHAPSSAVSNFDSLRTHIIQIFCDEYRHLVLVQPSQLIKDIRDFGFVMLSNQTIY